MVLIDDLVWANSKQHSGFARGKGHHEQKLDAVKAFPELFTHLSAIQNRSFSKYHLKELATLRRRIDETLGEEIDLIDLSELKEAGFYVYIDATSVRKPSSEISQLLAQAVFNYASFAERCMDRCFEPVSYMKFVAALRATSGKPIEEGRNGLFSLLAAEAPAGLRTIFKKIGKKAA
jgi:hypothetical protein